MTFIACALDLQFFQILYPANCKAHTGNSLEPTKNQNQKVSLCSTIHIRNAQYWIVLLTTVVYVIQSFGYYKHFTRDIKKMSWVTQRKNIFRDTAYSAAHADAVSIILHWFI
jgi:hypothetical protein